MVDIVRSGVEDGTFEPIDPEATARFLRLALQGAIAEALTLGSERTKPEVRSAAETYIDDVLLGQST